MTNYFDDDTDDINSRLERIEQALHGRNEPASDEPADVVDDEQFRESVVAEMNTTYARVIDGGGTSDAAMAAGIDALLAKNAERFQS